MCRILRSRHVLTLLAGFLLPLSGVIAEDSRITNASFDIADDDGQPVAWEVQANGHFVSVDNGALLIDSGEQPKGTYVRQLLPGELVRESSSRLIGKIKTRSVPISATLVAIVNGAEQQLFVDDMRDRVVAGDTEWTEYSIDIPTVPDAEVLEIGVLLIGGGTAWFDELSFGHVDEKGQPGEAQAYVRDAIEILRRQYRHSSDIDWDNILQTGISSINEEGTLKEAHGVVRSVLERMGGRHMQLVKPQTTRRSDRDNAPVVSVSVKRERNIGYVQVPKWSAAADSPASTDFVSRAHRDIESIAAGACGWIVDLRSNTGGNMWPMLAAIGPIAGEGDIGAFTNFAESVGSTVWWYRQGIAGTREGEQETARTEVPEQLMPEIPPSSPVAILTGPDTSSAGEAVAIALTGRPNTKVFGGQTAGWADANVAVPLSDGAILVFPAGYFADREGNVYPDGLKPDEAVDSGDVISAAEQWLLDHAACSNK